MLKRISQPRTADAVEIRAPRGEKYKVYVKYDEVSS